MLRVGIDVGGTFTDVVAVDSESGETLSLKLPSTPREPESGVLAAFDTALRERRAKASTVEFVAHSTTVGTNALLGQIGLELPRVAMLTTHGFRDVIEIGRQTRSRVYDLYVGRPRPLVARGDRFTVRERIGPNGDVLVRLDDAEIARACAELRAVPGIGAVAICLLHSYANDEHERRLAASVSQALPGATVVASSQVDPAYREFERFSTAVVNAALAPLVARYVERVCAGLQARGVRAGLYVMRSDGGLARAERIAQRPASVIESGPASGVIAAGALGERVGIGRLLSFDMGGTTAKAGTIVDGVAAIATEFEAAGRTHSGRAVKGSGYPVRYPFVDLAEVSAGGGTIAWLDAAGSLQVGPLSAGADPGPACYGRSSLATVTDANVVLGRLNPGHLLGGAFPIDAERARTAIAALADALSLRVEDAAAGIVALVDAQMSKALRIVTIERGLDPRDFTLVAFGGSGPLHACALADELGVTRVLVPRHPGVFSAQGLLDAALTERVARPVMRRVPDAGAALADTFQRWESRSRESLLGQGAVADTLAFCREVDARYASQSFELSVGYDQRPEVLSARFHQAHRRRYGYDVAGEPIEIVNARLTATGRLARVCAGRAPRGERSAEAISSRDVWHAGRRLREVAVYQRDALAEGAALSGPAVVEQYDSCTYLAPNWTLRVHDDLLVLQRAPEDA